MKLGMLTGIWYIAENLSLLDSLDRVADLGFRYVDLHGVFHAGPKHLSIDARREVKAKLASLGLIPRNYVLHTPYNIPCASPAELGKSYQYLCEGIDLAVSWGINQLMLNAGTWSFGLERKTGWKQSIEFIRRLCDYAAPRDLFIAQECEPYVWYLVNDIASTVRMRNDVDRENFTTLIDLGHMALAREGQSDLLLLADNIIHTHISDHEPRRHTNQVVGSGFTPAADYLSAMERVDMDGRMKRFGYDELVVSFELGFPGDRIDDPDDWVRRSLAHIHNVFPSLTQ